MTPPERVLFFAPSSRGGLAEHVHYQAVELARRGFAVTVVCRPDFFKSAGPLPYQLDPVLPLVTGKGLVHRVLRVAGSVTDWYVLAARIVQLRPQLVVWEANSEYYAPAWAWLHVLLRRRGMVALANFHDPVRARRWRPAWYHSATLRLAYAPLSGGLIHGTIPPEAEIPDRLLLRDAPFGMFADMAQTEPPFDARARLGILPAATVLLAFGHVADRKNLDHVVSALTDAPEVHLIVAGSAGSSADRPVEFYAAQANRLGVGDRVHFVSGFIPEADIAAYFVAADVVCLTYDRTFVSQSGVLQIAALFDRPVLASGGDGPMRRTVERYGLGITVEPDSAAAIVAGLEELRANPIDRQPAFAAYRDSMSWRTNVDRLLEVAAMVRDARTRSSARAVKVPA